MPDSQEPPSLAAVAIGTALVAGITGYYLGQARSIGLFGSSLQTSRPSNRNATASEVEHDDDSDISDVDAASDSDAQDLGELKNFPGSTEECKLILVVRSDLGMTKGKIAAQCGHATLACYKTLVRANPAHPILKQWETLGQAKVALKVGSEDEMLMLQAQAISLGLCAQVIHDAGRTQIASGSATVLGIGPAPKSKVDEVTGHLSLL
ncbi:putative peptidyl-tRNA hydrolase 2 [Fulvia fulva]|uniref:peptidyl-tRNA hydrolase n=1 Tax=Passalora fulva TaxID=5499 RepID=A0A9Q8L9T3_PASFU|nr:putative peptidyl-tRNA hydrolase 2 [Fulvia fulva]KAK4634725.1 putative peptidyl-tRNA hydrolase 2 [Fulvia fulva]KAK4637460.1 putative peptidyl-tRNA hydrolase 2 [Fulvia fulva]UJO12818.1 putative peptidyl-tRNA hydrolase 2 [Fulvia fulva]WPV09767.1 putative peptidyl-tRNA hydrolase 2 [Fulvia fulva]WPV24582.1 putative peptidyl-tRNA hydrolase 2 [Fulvia fulva]